MNQIVRSITSHPASTLGAVAFWGVLEFVALRRSQALLRQQDAAAE